MKMLKRVLAWGTAAIILGISSLYVATVHYLLDTEPGLLLSCVDVDVPWRAWTCKQVLRYASLTPKQVRDLNTKAGALYPASMDDPKEAEEMLTLFLSRGVDINARHQQAKGWTALHTVATVDPPARVALLLKHGAHTDIRDDDGRTPLDLARRMLQKYPDDPNLPETIRLLEAAERK